MQQQRALIDQTSAQNYPAFLKEVTRFFQLSKKAFLTKTFFSAKDYVNPAPAYRLLQAHPLKTLDTFLNRFFHIKQSANCLAVLRPILARRRMLRQRHLR